MPSLNTLFLIFEALGAQPIPQKTGIARAKEDRDTRILRRRHV